MCQFVPNFVSCVSAKYLLNWFTVGKVIAKIKRGVFIETQYVLLGSGIKVYIDAGQHLSAVVGGTS